MTSHYQAGKCTFRVGQNELSKTIREKFEELYRQIGTEINSGKTLTILSEGILFQASRLVAKGAMDIGKRRVSLRPSHGRKQLLRRV
ncbi:hypothetical protein J4727_12530 [Providencia rettgeri]|uniref:Uncharacterized protein n=1 Tax=Providencia rettgeri TaxID=587 RepID=A0A939NAY1_PRORE|nr:hypothetical protein [Providencia rettgeri]